uniref:Uncharacterized protein n=1 Tax=Sinocyclocheilus grahami TaxID=75366 RepID=A0A672N2D2_SINGR
MAPAGGGVVLAALSLLYLCGAILSSEYFSTLTFFNSDLHKHGCSSPAEWEEYAPDCESSILQLEDPDCEEGSNPSCESIFSLNAEKILNQAKLFVEQRRFPFAVENQNTNEELAIGYVLIGNGLFDEAIKHFSLLLQGDPELVSAIYGRGIAYGKKSLQDIKNADLALYELSRVIALEPSRPEVYEQRAEILSPLGRISEALSDLTKAIQLQPSARLYRHRGTLLFISEVHRHSHLICQVNFDFDLNRLLHLFDQNTAKKTSFQKALLLDQNHIQSLQLRGMMLYHHGSLQEAIGSFKRCLQLEPYNEVCQYMKGLSHVAMGQFYEGIKAQTKVMLNDPLLGQKASSEYLKVRYLRGEKLEPYNNFHVVVNKHYIMCIQVIIFLNCIFNVVLCFYCVFCVAMGLATLEVMQAMQRTWSNSKVRVNGKTRQLQWRDMFDIAVKWRRIADPDQPVLWLDQMPARSLSRGFNNHINLIRGQIINIRYLEYFRSILGFVKERILVYHGAYNPRGLQDVKQALENVNKVEDLLPIMKFNSKTRDGFTVNSKVPKIKTNTVVNVAAISYKNVKLHSVNFLGLKMIQNQL